jgi:hypothetical protein
MITKLISFVSKNQKYFTIGGACILLILNGQQRSQIIELREAQHLGSGDIQKAQVVDSLETELTNSQNLNSRYELALEYLYESDSNLAKEFEANVNNPGK